MGDAKTPPPATGMRIHWPQVPARVRAAIESRFGGEVVRATTQPTGFSPGLAAILERRDGYRIFVKACGPEQNPQSPGIHRREASIVSRLPSGIPVSRFLWAYDEAPDGWVALAFEVIDGRMPAQPWRADELDRVIAAMAALAASLTPSPLPEGTVRSAPETFASTFCGWGKLAAAPAPQLDAWSVRHLGLLADLELRAPEAVRGDTLLHVDIRADNILLTDSSVYFVDWPHARIGAAWVDVIGFAPSVAMQGGPEPEELFGRFPYATTAERDAVTAGIAAIGGYFTWQALQPPPPGLPTVRAFQAAQGAVVRRWLAQRTGWR